MSLTVVLATFRSKAAQADSLVSNSHQTDTRGIPFFSVNDRHQITVAAFLNLFIGWEEFLEAALSNFMSGASTLSGTLPTKYATPSTLQNARAMVMGINRYFDYANHEYVRKMVSLYFQDGHPFEPHLSAIASDLADIRTMRNASAHLSSTTQAALEALAQRIFSIPKPGIDLYTILTAVDPRSTAKNTVLANSRDKLLTAAELIANG